jgi:hypothetical protein
LNPLTALPYIIGIAVLTAAGWFVYGAGEAHTQVKWDAATKTQQGAAIAQLGDNQVALEAEILKRKNAEAQHDIDQGIIDSLADNIARSVPVHFPTTCRGAVPSGSVAGASQDGAGGILSDRVDQLFAEIQSRTSALIKRCDEMNADAIRLNREIHQ